MRHDGPKWVKEEEVSAPFEERRMGKKPKEKKRKEMSGKR